MFDTPTKREVATAWGLWKSLHKHAQAIWDRYETPFSEIIIEEQRLESMRSPPELEDYLEEDIPF